MKKVILQCYIRCLASYVAYVEWMLQINQPPSCKLTLLRFWDMTPFLQKRSLQLKQKKQYVTIIKVIICIGEYLIDSNLYHVFLIALRCELMPRNFSHWTELQQAIHFLQLFGNDSAFVQRVVFIIDKLFLHFNHIR